MTVNGRRVRAMIVVLWRPGLRSRSRGTRALHCFAIAAEPVNERESRAVIDGAFPELFACFGARSIAPVGPTLIRYLSFDAARRPGRIEVGEDASDAPDEAGLAGLVPAGRCATVVHVGPYTPKLLRSGVAFQRFPLSPTGRRKHPPRLCCATPGGRRKGVRRLPSRPPTATLYRAHRTHRPLPAPGATRLQLRHP